MSKLKITTAETPGKITPKAITVREPLVEDFMEAQKHGDNMKMTAALVAQICTFDGAQLTVEEVAKLPVSYFLELSGELMSRGFLGSKELLSTLSETDASDTAK